LGRRLGRRRQDPGHEDDSGHNAEHSSPLPPPEHRAPVGWQDGGHHHEEGPPRSCSHADHLRSGADPGCMNSKGASIGGPKRAQEDAVSAGRWGDPGWAPPRTGPCRARGMRATPSTCRLGCEAGRHDNPTRAGRRALAAKMLSTAAESFFTRRRLGADGNGKHAQSPGPRAARCAALAACRVRRTRRRCPGSRPGRSHPYEPQPGAAAGWPPSRSAAGHCAGVLPYHPAT
jgi:hypothetical protein